MIVHTCVHEKTLRMAILRFTEEFLNWVNNEIIYCLLTLICTLHIWDPFVEKFVNSFRVSFIRGSTAVIILIFLSRCCIQCGIFSLSNVLQCQITREIFVQEGLMDYMVSVPWFYPSQWQERENAQQLVTFLGQKLQLQPPSLLNLTKAHLAATCFGLDKVLRIESLHEFLSEMYTS